MENSYPKRKKVSLELLNLSNPFFRILKWSVILGFISLVVGSASAFLFTGTGKSNSVSRLEFLDRVFSSTGRNFYRMVIFLLREKRY